MIAVMRKQDEVQTRLRAAPRKHDGHCWLLSWALAGGVGEARRGESRAGRRDVVRGSEHDGRKATARTGVAASSRGRGRLPAALYQGQVPERSDQRVDLPDATSPDPANNIRLNFKENGPKLTGVLAVPRRAAAVARRLETIVGSSDDGRQGA